jgi:hypothetical protein
VVELKLQRRSLHLLVDTGASDLTLFQGATRAVTTIGTRTGSNMGGELRVQEVKTRRRLHGLDVLGHTTRFHHDKEQPPESY